LLRELGTNSGSDSDEQQQQRYPSAMGQLLRDDGDGLYNANPAATCLAFKVLFV